MPRSATFTVVVSSLLLTACSTFGIRSGTEQPAYAVVEDKAAEGAGTIEIRRYGPRLAAEVTVEGEEKEARSAGFRALAAYIFGDNQERAEIAMTAPGEGRNEGETIAMTAPVAQARSGDGRWVVRFFMPARYGRDMLPEPVDARIAIVELPEETMAVVRFSGARDPAAVDVATQALLRSLDGARWRPSGVPVAYFYDPPWTLPFLRRNEVAVPVAPAR